VARIARITLYRLEIPFRGVFRIATAEYVRQPYVVCEVESDEGLVGYGEACPAYEFTGETGGTVVAAIRELLARKLLGRDPLDIEAVSDDLASTCAGNPSAKAALETALYDLACKTLGIPLYRLLGGPVRRRLPLSGTITIMPPDEASRRAAELAEGGVRVVKVKVGTDPREDAERVRAVRDAVGSDVEIRVDANQGYEGRRDTRVPKDSRRCEGRRGLLLHGGHGRDHDRHLRGDPHPVLQRHRRHGGCLAPAQLSRRRHR